MDVFSGIKNITQKTQNFDNINHSNIYNKNNTEQIKQAELRNDNNSKIDDNMENIKKQDKEKLKEELRKITEELNKALNPLNITLKFHFNDKVDELMVKVIDTKDDRVIREYPPKEALKLMQKMREIVGLLFDKKG